MQRAFRRVQNSRNREPAPCERAKRFSSKTSVDVAHSRGRSSSSTASSVRRADPREMGTGIRTEDSGEAAGTEQGGIIGAIGTGVITGAADDDPSAIGTYASAGAKFGLSFLWIAPVLLPMMYVVVYLSAKLGRVYGKGLFAIIRDRYPRCRP